MSCAHRFDQLGGWFERVLTGRIKTPGLASAGEIFDAADFLHALAPHIALDLHPQNGNA
ncbi:hypothetical protein [Streptomyces griseoluteus]|uniref:hypothetical protein n=1 Tax=Streptomyces griseoluteus TaxID=29306 RepID=UPI0036F8EF02